MANCCNRPPYVKRGQLDKYKQFNLMLTRPTLPVRVKFRNALPATFVPRLVGAMGGTPDAPRSPYRGVAPYDLAPQIIPRHPWER